MTDTDDESVNAPANNEGVDTAELDDVTAAVEADQIADSSTLTMPRRARIWWVTGPLLAISWLATIVMLLLPSPYSTMSPGQVKDTSHLITIQKGVKTYSHSGQFAYVTVTETARPLYAQTLWGWLHPAIDVFPTEALIGDRTIEEDRRYAAVMMNNSQQSAAFQALTLLGYNTQKVASGVFINQIVPHSPADGKLSAADVITAIDKTPIYTTQDLAKFMQKVKPGQSVVLTVDRIGVDANLKVTVKLGSHKVEGETRPYLGIFMETRPHFKVPFTVEFDTGNVGGPSAGLALTLSLMDQLSPKGLTRGHDIAVTGTVQLDGSVGQIGGIRQKTHAVVRSGADVFLVPEGNYEEAKEIAGDQVRVIAVTSIEDALAKLKKLPKPD